MFPNSGSEFDDLIVVQNNKEPNSFHIEVPKKLEGSGSARVYLSYSKSSGGEAVPDITEELKFWFNWSVVSGDFSAPKKEGYIPYIRVVWPGEVCDTVANSKYLGSAK
ncbi:hypothetical protein GCM10007978_43520 [Shewanella hanedai]|uniref:Uncharacterized protein n=2 Tax=Shewanella hanedai TaxID=25 RepID=A0A553JHV1_SHEHA|nr:hypothetical protein [Shewanella hanedai]TRY12029.1 hypothetical protein FN961_22520 [Shewanella hanedai]GGJ01156.1 hypothetical protein GCM10007978_43520 [Shewanella hanedai]